MLNSSFDGCHLLVQSILAKKKMLDLQFGVCTQS